MLLEQVWDDGGSFVEENTLHVTLNRLKKKIEPDPAHPVYVKMCLGLAIRLENNMFRKEKAQQEMEEISRMLERILNGECIQQEEVRYEDTLPAKIRYQIRRISEKIRAWKLRITRERDETKALIGEIAHQMRNPLAGVESYTAFRARYQESREGHTCAHWNNPNSGCIF